MPAIIGITVTLRRVHTDAGETPGYAVLPTYTSMVRAAGALPVLLPPLPVAAVPTLLDRVDGVILSGGGDVDPARYGGTPHDTVYGVNRERDDFELAIARVAAERRFPVLCICRGMQVMNVALGGTLIEDIPSRVSGPIEHNAGGDAASRPQHGVTVTESSANAAALGTTTLEVNSIHHQSVDVLGEGLVATGHSGDGIIEALEPTDASWPMWAVQWHPEHLGPSDAPSLGLFRALAKAASE